jgi:dUTP pyrophosphatase
MLEVSSAPTINVELVHPRARVPTRAYDGDAGYDLRCVDAFTLGVGERAVVDTGIRIALSADVAALVVPRSGLAARDGVTVVNGPGLVDPNYRGEIRVVLINHGEYEFAAASGERIAQLLFIPVAAVKLTEGSLAEGEMSARGTNGFGSSGR